MILVMGKDVYDQAKSNNPRRRKDLMSKREIDSYKKRKIKKYREKRFLVDN